MKLHMIILIPFCMGVIFLNWYLLICLGGDFSFSGAIFSALAFLAINKSLNQQDQDISNVKSREEQKAHNAKVDKTMGHIMRWYTDILPEITRLESAERTGRTSYNLAVLPPFTDIQIPKDRDDLYTRHSPTYEGVKNTLASPIHQDIELILYRIEGFSNLLLNGDFDLDLASRVLSAEFIFRVKRYSGFISYYKVDNQPFHYNQTFQLLQRFMDSEKKS